MFSAVFSNVNYNVQINAKYMGQYELTVLNLTH